MCLMWERMRRSWARRRCCCWRVRPALAIKWINVSVILSRTRWMWSFSSRVFRVLDRKVYTPECTEREREGETHTQRGWSRGDWRCAWDIILSQCPSLAQQAGRWGPLWSRQLRKIPTCEPVSRVCHSQTQERHCESQGRGGSTSCPFSDRFDANTNYPVNADDDLVRGKLSLLFKWRNQGQRDALTKMTQSMGVSNTEDEPQKADSISGHYNGDAQETRTSWWAAQREWKWFGKWLTGHFSR